MVRFLCLALLVAAGCGDDDGVNGCLTRADCPADQVCINGGCSLVAADAASDAADGSVADVETSDAETPDAQAPDARDDCRVSTCPQDLRCDPANGLCVQCLSPGDCGSGVCTDGVCTRCTETSECTAPQASACDIATGVCGSCTTDAECTDLIEEGAPVSAPLCAAGLCVECTASNNAACDGRSCDPATNRCTETLLASLDSCEACVTDGECMDGRCVELTFMGTAGSYCLRDEADGACPRGYRTPRDAISVSGVPGSYCGINELTSCEALLAIGDSCSVASDCPFGGACEDFGDNLCTIRCEGTRDCPQGGGSVGSCDNGFCIARR